MVIRESTFWKLACESLFLLAVLFIWLGEGWLPSLVLRGAIGLAAIILAALFLPGFEFRGERHKG